MKANKIFAAAMAALALAGFSACEPTNETEVTDLTLDKTSVTVEVGESATIVATVTPAGAATVTWENQNPDVVSVKDGVVTGLKEGSSIVVAKAGTKSASCVVKVGKVNDADEQFLKLLQGSDYYVFNLDDASFEKIKGKVKGDFRLNGEYLEDGSIPEETTSVLEIWGNSFKGAAGGGLNCFGETEGYISLESQQGDGWGVGCGGIRQTHRTIDLTGVTGDYTFAIVYKCPANNTSSSAKFTFYSTTQGQPEVAREVSGNTTGEWKLLEYPMSELFAAGLDWTNVADCKDGTYAWYSLGLLINGIGQGLDIDAVLVYKK